MKIRKVHLQRLNASRDLRVETPVCFQDADQGLEVLSTDRHCIWNRLIFFISQGDPEFGFLLAGAFFGLFLRDIAWFRMTAQFWPVSDAITDWDKVDELINEKEA